MINRNWKSQRGDTFWTLVVLALVAWLVGSALFGDEDEPVRQPPQAAPAGQPQPDTPASPGVNGAAPTYSTSPSSSSSSATYSTPSGGGIHIPPTETFRVGPNGKLQRYTIPGIDTRPGLPSADLPPHIQRAMERLKKERAAAPVKAVPMVATPVAQPEAMRVAPARVQRRIEVAPARKVRRRR